MRFGICTGLEDLSLVEKLGYDYIEPQVVKTMALSPKEQDMYREQLESSSVKCEAFNVLFPQDMKLIDGSVGKKELKEYVDKAMAMVKSFGASVVVFGSGGCRRCPDDITYAKGYRRLVKVYRRVGRIAAEYGITVVAEPLNRSESNMINTLAEGAILVSDVGLDNVRLLADYYHIFKDNDHIEDILKIKDFGHIHIAMGKDRTYPVSKEGERFEEFFRALKAVGYDGRMSIEGNTDNIAKDAEEALAFLKDMDGST